MVLRDSEARFALVAAAVMLVLGLVAIVALVPSFVLVMGGGSATTTPSATRANDEATLVRAQALVELLAPSASAAHVSSVVSTALALRPAGVRVTSVSYTGSPGKTGTIQLAGTSDGRERIESYRTALRAAGPFATATVPVSALVGTTEGSFTMTLTGDF